MKVALTIAAVSVLASFVSAGKGIRMPDLKKKPRLESPRGSEQRTMAMVIASPPKRYALHWEYHLPLPRADTQFDIEAGPTPYGPWKKIGETNQPPFPVLVGGDPAGFWKVSTQDNL